MVPSLGACITEPKHPVILRAFVPEFMATKIYGDKIVSVDRLNSVSAQKRRGFLRSLLYVSAFAPER
jgi:hypothetical protein